MATTWTTKQNWNSVFSGSSTPLNSGWGIITNTVGDSVETITGGIYRLQAFGASNMRRNYTDPNAGDYSFSEGLTVEWYAKYALSVAGTAQSNIYLGESNDIFRVLYASSGITLRWLGLLYTDSTTTMTSFHKYRVVLQGTSCSYYVDDVLKTTVTRDGGVAGSGTNYIRMDHRCDAGSTYDVSYDYINIRRGVGNLAIPDFTIRTKPTTLYTGIHGGLWSISTQPWDSNYYPWIAPAILSTTWTERTQP